MGWIFRLSLMNMKRRKARTLLTLLGVAIGVLSVVALLSLGLGIKKQLLSSFGDESQVKQIVVTGSDNYKDRKKLITKKTLEKYAGFDHVSYVYPRQSVSALIALDSKYVAYTEIIGIPSEQLSKIKLVSGGSYVTSGNKPGLIMGNSMPYYFFDKNTDKGYFESNNKKFCELTGTNVDVSFGYTENSVSGKLKITGIREGKEEDYSEISSGVYCDIDVLIKYLKAKGYNDDINGIMAKEGGKAGSDWIYTNAVVVVDDIKNVDSVVKKFQDMGMQVYNEKEFLDNAKKTVNVIQVLLAGIGMIALIVAVIGISNTMTTSVYDRVKEIGVLKVIGSDISEIRAMFLFESAFLGFFGSVAGVCASFGVRGAINMLAVKLMQFEPGTKLAVIPLWLVVGAVIFATIFSILAGYIPARWASKLNGLKAITGQ